MNRKSRSKTEPTNITYGRNFDIPIVYFSQKNNYLKCFSNFIKREWKFFFLRGCDKLFVTIRCITYSFKSDEFYSVSILKLNLDIL